MESSLRVMQTLLLLQISSFFANRLDPIFIDCVRTHALLRWSHYGDEMAIIFHRIGDLDNAFAAVL